MGVGVFKNNLLEKSVPEIHILAVHKVLTLFMKGYSQVPGTVWA